MSMIEDLENLPDIDFVEKDVDTLLEAMVTEYESAYEESTGESKTLADGDPVRIWIYSQALRIYAAYQLIDQAAKYNLLRYSSGDYLENLGARVGVNRAEATAATTTQRFTLSAAQESAVAIASGTQVSAGGSIYFATTEYAEVVAGDTYVDVTVECTETGTDGNGYLAGQITTLVDPIQYVSSTTNTSTSQGGTDEEDDDTLKGRIFQKPESFSVAGPVGAYEYFTKECNSSIIDVSVTSASPGEVDVCFILTDGELPDSTLISEVEEYLSDDSRRPLTDNVTVSAPETVSYDIEATYYIKSSDKTSASTIQTAVTSAVDDYVIWQKSIIGRDINPSQLISDIIGAGAKRVVITSPEYTEVSDTQVALEGTVNLTYGGLEDE
ncbi:MAG: phage baseplate family protein [Firmicutes bacterium]|nr:phage baseplate family protein [Bacillota bacterium]